MITSFRKEHPLNIDSETLSILHRCMSSSVRDFARASLHEATMNPDGHLRPVPTLMRLGRDFHDGGFKSSPGKGVNLSPHASRNGLPHHRMYSLASVSHQTSSSATDSPRITPPSDSCSSTHGLHPPSIEPLHTGATSDSANFSYDRTLNGPSPPDPPRAGRTEEGVRGRATFIEPDVYQVSMFHKQIVKPTDMAVMTTARMVISTKLETLLFSSSNSTFWGSISSVSSAICLSSLGLFFL